MTRRRTRRCHSFTAVKGADDEGGDGGVPRQLDVGGDDDEKEEVLDGLGDAVGDELACLAARGLQAMGARSGPSCDGGGEPHRAHRFNIDGSVQH